MFKKFFINPVLITWVNIGIAMISCSICFLTIAFFEYHTILSWAIIFVLMLSNLCISGGLTYYHLKNSHFDYKSNLKYIIGLGLQLSLLIISFCLMMFNFYIILLLSTNIIYIVYWCCIFEQRATMEIFTDENI